MQMMGSHQGVQSQVKLAAVVCEGSFRARERDPKSNSDAIFPTQGKICRVGWDKVTSQPQPRIGGLTVRKKS